VSSIYFRDSEWTNPQWDPYPEHLKPIILWPMQKQLDELRDAWGAPMAVTPNGGYRSQRHNTAMKGAENSQHMQGKASDFSLPMPGGRSIGRVKRAMRVIAFRRLVLRMYRARHLPDLSGVGAYPWKGFVHLDFFGPRRKDGQPRSWWGQAWKRNRL